MTQTAPSPWQQPYYPAHPAAPRRRTGVAGLVVSLAGVLAIVVSFTSLAWFTDGKVRVGQDASGSFDIVHDAIIRTTLATGFAVEGKPVAALYFTWLGWALLLAAGVAAVLANTATGAAAVFRVVGTVLGLGAVGLTFAAIDLISVRPGATGRVDPGYGEYLDFAGPGFYAAIAGFALLAVGSLLGARRR